MLKCKCKEVNLLQQSSIVKRVLYISLMLSNNYNARRTRLVTVADQLEYVDLNFSFRLYGDSLENCNHASFFMSTLYHQKGKKSTGNGEGYTLMI
jgi:hypothetical protein